MRKRIGNHHPFLPLRSTEEMRRLHEEARTSGGIGPIRDVNAEAHALLQEGESMPKDVQRAISFFVRKKLWCIFSRNHAAGSCRDAIRKRNRLGGRGIPLEDELKSYFGKYRNADGDVCYVTFHCRGHQMLDWESIHAFLAKEHQLVGEVERLPEEELVDVFHMEYGRVNPFVLDRTFVKQPVLQVFDQATRSSTRAPYTMMTNAGDLTWAVEFRPSELVEALDGSVFRNICTVQKQTPPLPSIGIITGNTPESGVYLWNWINDSVRASLQQRFYGDISLPHVIVESVPALGLSIELDRREEETWQVLKSAVKSLCERGITFLALACNTAHFFTPQIRNLCEKYGTTFVSMAETTEEYLQSNDIREFALLGIELVANLQKPWSAYHRLRDFDVESLPERVYERMDALAHKVKSEGANESGLQLLRDVLKQDVKSQHVVLAMTELSILLAFQKKRGKRKVLIEPLKLYANAISQAYIERATAHQSAVL